MSPEIGSVQLTTGLVEGVEGGKMTGRGAAGRAWRGEARYRARGPGRSRQGGRGWAQVGRGRASYGSVSARRGRRGPEGHGTCWRRASARHGRATRRRSQARRKRQHGSNRNPASAKDRQNTTSAPAATVELVSNLEDFQLGADRDRDYGQVLLRAKAKSAERCVDDGVTRREPRIRANGRRARRSGMPGGSATIENAA